MGSRRFGIALAGGVGGGIGYHVYGNEGSQTALLQLQSVEQHLSLVFPTMEALLRAGRLVKTAAIMAVDYQMYFMTKKHPDSLLNKFYSNEEESERQKAEQLVYQLQEELEQAQAAYVEGSNDDDSTDTDTNIEDAVEQNNESRSKDMKQHMINVSNQLADAEDALDKSGNSNTVHERNASRLLELFRANAGVYIKVGQHLANLDLLLPQEYLSRLSSLFDDAPVSSYEDGKLLVSKLNSSVDAYCNCEISFS